MKKVLVTGATGFIGPTLVNQLLAQGDQVRVFVRSLKKAQIFPPEVEVLVGDLSDEQSLAQACQGIHTIFHLAGHAHAWAEKNGEKHHAVNYLGTKNLLQAAIQAKVAGFIYFSTVKAVADSPNCIDETFAELPTTPYGIAKRQAEQFILTEAAQHQMHACILRPALVYGPRWKGNLATMLRAIDKGYFPSLPEVGNCRSMVSLNDLCAAAILAAESTQANGKVYFVTDGSHYSTRQIYEQMCAALGKSPSRWVIPYSLLNLLAKTGDMVGQLLKRRFPFDSQALNKLIGSAEYSSAKIQTELGFSARDNLKELLPEIITSILKS